MLANYLVPCYIHTSFSCRFLSWCHREEFLSVCDLQANNDILAFLSGMPVTRNTKYLDLKNAVSHWTVILQTHHTSCVACFLFFFFFSVVSLFFCPSGITTEIKIGTIE